MPSATTTTLSDAQIAGYARAAGFPENQIAIAVAVARAESGGNPRAHNATPPDNSYGLWQINMLGSLGPARRKEFGISSNDALYDPATNARAAYKVWRSAGGSWRPWTTYTGGRYKTYLGGTAPGSSGPGLDPDITKRQIEDAADKAWESIGVPTSVRRFLEGMAALAETARKAFWTWLVVVLALVLLVLGFVILNRARLKSAAKIGVSALTKGVVK